MPVGYIEQYVDSALPVDNATTTSNADNRSLADVFLFLLVDQGSTPWNGVDVHSQIFMVSIKGP